MSEPMVMFGPDGETLVPFPVLRQKVNADLAQLAATKKRKGQKTDEFSTKQAEEEGLFGLVDPFPPLPARCGFSNQLR